MRKVNAMYDNAESDKINSREQDTPIPFFYTPWIHASKTRLQSKDKWVSGSLNNQSHPWSQITLSGENREDKVRLTIEYGRGNRESGPEIDIETSISTSNGYLENLRDLVSDSFDAYLYFWDMRAKYVTDTVVVTERELAEVLGLEVQKNGSYHPKTRRELTKIASLWDALKADVKASVRKKTQTGEEISRYLKVEGRFFELSMFEEGEEVESVKKWSRVCWMYQIGTVLMPFLEKPNKELAYIPKKILQYRGKVFRATKRIGRSCLYLLRSGANGRDLRIASIAEILAEAGVAFKHRHPRTSLEQFEDARERLVKDKIFQTIDYASSEDATYFANIMKGSKDRRFKKRWLEAKVVIKPILGDHRQNADVQQTEISKSPANKLTADLVKYLAWSQISKTQLADNIGIGKSSLSMLLSQTRKPSRGNKGKIEAFLSSVDHLPYKN